MVNKQTNPTIINELYEIMYNIDSLFNKYNIFYWADGGTLIGGVRHEGIIPWDDDLDICILGKDERKLLTKIKLELHKINMDIKKGFSGYKVFKTNGKPIHQHFNGIDYNFKFPFCDIILMEKSRNKYIPNQSCYADSSLNKMDNRYRNRVYGLFPYEKYWYKSFKNPKRVKFGCDKCKINIPPLKISTDFLIRYYGSDVLKTGKVMNIGHDTSKAIQDREINTIIFSDNEFPPAKPFYEPSNLTKIKNSRSRTRRTSRTSRTSRHTKKTTHKKKTKHKRKLCTSNRPSKMFAMEPLVENGYCIDIDPKSISKLYNKNNNNKFGFTYWDTYYNDELKVYDKLDADNIIMEKKCTVIIDNHTTLFEIVTKYGLEDYYPEFYLDYRELTKDKFNNNNKLRLFFVKHIAQSVGRGINIFNNWIDYYNFINSNDVKSYIIQRAEDIGYISTETYKFITDINYKKEHIKKFAMRYYILLFGNGDLYFYRDAQIYSSNDPITPYNYLDTDPNIQTTHDDRNVTPVRDERIKLVLSHYPEWYKLIEDYSQHLKETKDIFKELIKRCHKLFPNMKNIGNPTKEYQLYAIDVVLNKNNEQKTIEFNNMPLIIKGIDSKTNDYYTRMSLGILTLMGYKIKPLRKYKDMYKHFKTNYNLKIKNYDELWEKII